VIIPKSNEKMKIKPLPPDKVVKALRKIGFEVIRQKGSHVFLKHPDGRTTVVPVHKGEEIGGGLLRKIIKDAKIAPGEFMKVVEEL
jgi:predicted RNA binding protein YcfA (HicA-like mRNA interferase family)